MKDLDIMKAAIVEIKIDLERKDLKIRHLYDLIDKIEKSISRDRADQWKIIAELLDKVK